MVSPLLELRDVVEGDPATFFEHQNDPEAARMAAFAPAPPLDRDAFMARWRTLLDDDAVTKRTIVAGGQIAGYIAAFRRGARTEVTYWVGREFWGRGIATAALACFLGLVTTRPLWARAARDNAASLRVLRKCGFVIEGRERAFAEARREEIEELVLRLD